MVISRLSTVMPAARSQACADCEHLSALPGIHAFLAKRVVDGRYASAFTRILDALRPGMTARVNTP
jgi:hypothetical protein